MEMKKAKDCHDGDSYSRRRCLADVVIKAAGARSGLQSISLMCLTVMLLTVQVHGMPVSGGDSHCGNDRGSDVSFTGECLLSEDGVLLMDACTRDLNLVFERVKVPGGVQHVLLGNGKWVYPGQLGEVGGDEGAGKGKEKGAASDAGAEGGLAFLDIESRTGVDREFMEVTVGGLKQLRGLSVTLENFNTLKDTLKDLKPRSLCHLVSIVIRIGNFTLSRGKELLRKDLELISSLLNARGDGSLQCSTLDSPIPVNSVIPSAQTDKFVCYNGEQAPVTLCTAGTQVNDQRFIIQCEKHLQKSSGRDLFALSREGTKEHLVDEGPSTIELTLIQDGNRNTSTKSEDGALLGPIYVVPITTFLCFVIIFVIIHISKGRSEEESTSALSRESSEIQHSACVLENKGDGEKANIKVVDESRPPHMFVEAERVEKPPSKEQCISNALTKESLPGLDNECNSGDSILTEGSYDYISDDYLEVVGSARSCRETCGPCDPTSHGFQKTSGQHYSEPNEDNGKYGYSVPADMFQEEAYYDASDAEKQVADRKYICGPDGIVICDDAQSSPVTESPALVDEDIYARQNSATGTTNHNQNSLDASRFGGNNLTNDKLKKKSSDGSTNSQAKNDVNFICEAQTRFQKKVLKRFNSHCLSVGIPVWKSRSEIEFRRYLYEWPACCTVFDDSDNNSARPGASNPKDKASSAASRAGQGAHGTSGSGGVNDGVGDMQGDGHFSQQQHDVEGSKCVYDYKDLFECLINIHNANFIVSRRDLNSSSSSPSVKQWGLIQIQMETKTVEQLRKIFVELDSTYSHVGVDDKLSVVDMGVAGNHFNTSSENNERGSFISDREALGRSLVHCHHSAHCRIFARRGIPNSTRAAVWEAILAMDTSPQGRIRYNELCIAVALKELATDALYKADVKSTSSNDDDYFIFEDSIYQCLLAFSRDSYVQEHLQAPVALCPPVAKNDSRTLENLCRPVIPMGGMAMYVAPFCYVYPEVHQIYTGFRQMYVRYFCRLHSISLEENSLLNICILFEQLLQKNHPSLFFHLKYVGTDPLRIAVRWIIFAFSGFLNAEQVLILWDRILGFDSLDVLPVLAVAIFSFRKASLMNATSQEHVESIMDDLSSINVITLLQYSLFSVK
eukprot:Nk52_evm15s96 gene=Nk52_evmTU15s96